MDISLIASVLLLVLLFSSFLMKNTKLSGILNAIIFFYAAYLLSGSTDSLGDTIIYTAVGITAAAGVLGFSAISEKRFIRLIFGALSAALLVLISNGKVVEIFGEKTAVMNKFVLGGIALALLTFEVAAIKRYVLSKLKLKAPELDASIEAIFLALVLFLGMFGASYIGVLMVSVMLLVQATLAKKAGDLVLVPVTVLLYPILTQNESPMLVQGDVLLGLFLGIGLGKFIKSIEVIGTNKIFWGLTSLLLSLVVLFSIGYAGTMFSSMGGRDAVYAALFGIMLVAYLLKGSELLKANYILGVIVALFFGFTTLQSQDGQTSLNKSELDTEKEAKENELLLVPFDESLNGMYEIVSDSSRVDFDLGEKDVTKGAFKKIDGVFRMDLATYGMSGSISLNMDNFTTFNKFRDESLHGPEYFNSDKFPTMSFDAKKAEKVDDENYKLIGEFRMLGKSKALTLSLNRLDAQEGYVRITGKAEIDRTEYGMTPSIAEGNIVRFTYSALLKRK